MNLQRVRGNGYPLAFKHYLCAEKFRCGFALDLGFDFEWCFYIICNCAGPVLEGSALCHTNKGGSFVLQLATLFTGLATSSRGVMDDADARGCFIDLLTPVTTDSESLYFAVLDGDAKEQVLLVLQ